MRPTACSTWAFCRREKDRRRHAENAPNAFVLRHHRPLDRGGCGHVLARPRGGGDRAQGRDRDTVDQCIVHVPQVLKADLLRATIAAWGHERVIVFARTRSRADATCRRLKRAGYSVEAIHSSRTQNQRRRALENFAAGTTDILVATTCSPAASMSTR
mgnify:CR=1 FL=1